MNPDTPESVAAEPAAVVTADPQGDAKAYAESKAKPTAPAAPAEPATEPPATPDDAKAQAEAAEQQKRSRTTQYIDRLKAERDQYRQQVEQFNRSQPARPTPGPSGAQPERQRPPTLEECDFDPARWQTANNEWIKADLRREVEAEEARKREQQTLGTYQQKLAAFVEDHPDFEEAVGSIDPRFFSPELERAILSHDKGPALAYHLATNEDALWQIASVRPDLVPEAINRMASRLGSAPAVTQQAPPVAPVPPVTPPKPLSKAPPPAPVLSGRAPNTPSPEKMTDDDWYKADRERRRKR